MAVLEEIEQTEPGQRMPCGGVLHGKGLTWAQAIELKNNGHLFANLTNEFKPGNGEGMDKHTYAVYTAPHHVARLEVHLAQALPRQRQLSLLEPA